VLKRNLKDTIGRNGAEWEKKWKRKCSESITCINRALLIHLRRSVMVHCQSRSSREANIYISRARILCRAWNSDCWGQMDRQAHYIPSSRAFARPKSILGDKGVYWELLMVEDASSREHEATLSVDIREAPRIHRRIFNMSIASV
jgi:hypothetical protein